MVRTLVPTSDLVPLSGLDRAGYREAFSASCPATAPWLSAEEWARAMIEEAPPPMRDGMRAFWPRVGIRLGPVGSTEHVHGWRILRTEPDVLVLGVESFLLGRVRIVLHVRREEPGTTLDWAMLIRYAGLRGRVAWAPIAPFHRPFVRRLLAIVTTPDRFTASASDGRSRAQ